MRKPIILLVLVAFCAPIRAADYRVDSPANTVDAIPGDGLCDDGAGVCTLRAAIQEANLDGEVSLITFAEEFTGPGTILTDGLPALTEAGTVIDASDRWSGSWPAGRPGVELAGDDLEDGLIHIQADSCEIRGLLLAGAGETDGVLVEDADDCVIGGAGNGARCVFETAHIGARIIGGRDNRVEGCWFGSRNGVDLAPTGPDTGVRIESDRAVVQGNLVVGCDEEGILVWSGSHDCLVRENVVGVGVNRQVPLPNFMGIEVYGDGHQVGPDNFVGGNERHGLYVHIGIGSLVIGNELGRAEGSLGNGGHGLMLHGIDQAVVGGVEAGQGNRIAGNAECGIYMLYTDGAEILGNRIETSGADGVRLEDCREDRVGGGPGEGNVILGSGEAGVHLHLAEDCSILGNWIGLDPDGGESGGNVGPGVLLDGDTRLNRIGDREGSGNRIAGNDGAGIRMEGSEATRNRVEGNSIHSNGGPGILLLDGANGGVSPPVLDQVSLTGPITGSTGPGIWVELFSDLGDQGRILEGALLTEGSGLFTFPGPITGPNVTVTGTDVAGNSSAFSPARELVPEGVCLEMPARTFSPGSSCFLEAHLIPGGFPLAQAPLFVLLQVGSDFWFWPGWSREEDHRKVDIGSTGRTMTILPEFAWPDTGSDQAAGLVFWGALLNRDMTRVLGGDAGLGRWEFAFGPVTS